MYYPDNIVITWKTPPVFDENTGDFTAGQEGSFTSECRCVPSSSSKKVFGQDNVKIDYMYDVYMPLTTVVIPDFIAEYKLTQADGKILTGTVKTSKNNSFNSRLWL